MTLRICHFAALMLALAIAPQSAAGDESFAGGANLDNGERLFLRCKACHTVTGGDQAEQRFGPSLAGLFDRTAGSLENYPYSRALQDASFRWTPETLDAWLANPNSFLPGNKMAFAGFRSDTDRRDLIAYLQTATKPVTTAR